MSSLWSRYLKRVLLGGRGESKKSSGKLTRNTTRKRLSFEQLEDRLVPSGTWDQLSTNVSTGWGQPMLLSNGDVMIQVSPNGAQSNVWYTLAPGPDGSYLDGTLTKIAPMGLARLAYGSAVLTNGDVMVYGGEYSGAGSSPTFVNSGQIYNPSTNTWKTIASIPTSLDPQNLFGDDPLELLPNGNVLAGSLTGPATYIYNPTTNTWSAGPTKIDPNAPGQPQPESTDEESWVKLPGTGGNILDYELWASLGTTPGYGEYLDTSKMQWVATGPVPVPLSNTNEFELGPAALMPTGQVLQLGANGKGGSPSNTAIYDPGSNTWSAGPQIPGGMEPDDAPAAVLPDGNVMFAADAGPTSGASFSNGGPLFQPPTNLYEFNGISMGQMTVPAALASQLATQPAFDDQMLVLPTGQVLFDNDTSDLWLYSENGSPDPSWAPTITGVTSSGSNTFTLTGTQLNGMDEGAEYGDDAQMASNYPIVQLSDSKGDVFNATSFNWSSTGVATGSEQVSTEFSLPKNLPIGTYSLSVNAVGISSQPVQAFYNGSQLIVNPVVTGISPSTGSVAGGTTVTITGVGLDNATEVDFGPNNPATIVSDTDSQLVVTSPAGAAGTIDVTVTTPGGNSATSPSDLFTYAVIPAVTGISPSAGPQAGGTLATITGSGFSNATAVDFGSKSVAFTIISDSEIQADSPAGTVGTVDVTVSNANGASSTSSSDQFTYVAPPSVTAINPNSGTIQGGVAVTITGTNLTNASEVEFGSTPATILSDTATQIVVDSPAVNGIGSLDVTVTTLGGTSVTSNADLFNYLTVPTVTGISPNSGPLYGDELVTITGTSLINATAVDFGSRAASIVSNTNNQIVAICPGGVAGIADVTVTTSYGTSAISSADQFTYIPVPTISFIGTPAGPANGGTTITITGSNLINATSVDFGTNAATIVSNTATQIVVTDPKGTPGSVDVTVTTPGGTSLTTLATLFTYVSAPVVTGVSPAQGPVTAGEVVTITGTGLAGATAVDFGGIPALGFTHDFASQVVAFAPAGVAGPVDITVTTAGGASATSAADLFTYVAAPVVTGLSTTAGPLSGNTSITISGTNLSNATAVDFGNKAAKIISINNTGTQLVALSPAESSGIVQVTVTTVGGTSVTSPADQFIYEPVPAVTSLNTTNGSVSGGDTVTISGTGLSGATVDFGASAATIVSDSATQIIVTSPAGSAGTVDVTVTTGGGTSATSTADLFTYGSGAVAQVESITPSTGLVSGGTSVTINGANFTANSSVMFGNTPASTFKVISSSEIVASAPPGSPNSQVDVTVSNTLGTSATSTADQFTFVPFSLTTSTLTLTQPTVQSDSSVTVSVQVKDANQNAIANGNLTVSFQLASITGGQGTFGPTTYNVQSGLYSANFTGTIAGNNFITAIIDGSRVASSTPAIQVTPAQASVATSLITLSSSTITAGSTITVTFQAVDAEGNKLKTGGSTVSFGFANTKVISGTFGPTIDKNNGTYTATFTGSTAGTNAIVATLGNSTVAASAPVTVVPGKVSPLQSMVTLDSGTVESGTGTTVTLQAKDAFGNNVTTGGLVVAFRLGSGGTGTGTFSKVTDNGNGTYTATFIGAIAGNNFIFATIGRVLVSSSAPNFTVNPGPVSLAKSTIALGGPSVIAGNTVTVTLQARDAAGNIVSANNLAVTFYVKTTTGGQGIFTFATPVKNANGAYSATFTGTFSGINTVGASINGQVVISKLPAIKVTPGPASLANSLVLIPVNKVVVGGTTTVILQARDAYGSKLTTGGLNVLFILLNPTGASGNFAKVIDNHNGTYTVSFRGLVSGQNEIFAEINGQVLTTNPATIIVK